MHINYLCPSRNISSQPHAAKSVFCVRKKIRKKGPCFGFGGAARESGCLKIPYLDHQAVRISRQQKWRMLKKSFKVILFAWKSEGFTTLWVVECRNRILGTSTNSISFLANLKHFVVGCVMLCCCSYLLEANTGSKCEQKKIQNELIMEGVSDFI